MNFWEKLKAKNRPILALAPMVGVTDSAFRQMCKEFGADLVYSEMVSTEGLFYENQKSLNLTEFDENERPIIVQLMGSDPKKFAESAKQLESMGVDGIDINFGCPAKKIVNNCSGVQLMENLDLAHKIIKATTDAVSIPVSCKIRKSKFSKELGREVTGLEFVRRMDDLPIAALMVHGRKYEQVHAGEVDFDSIREIKEAFGGIVLSNGGVDGPQAAGRVLEHTQADGLGIARGSHGKPYIFKQIRHYLKTGEVWEPNAREIKEMALRHTELSFALKSGRGLIEMRKHLGWYVKGMENASQTRHKLVRASRLEEVRDILLTS